VRAAAVAPQRGDYRSGRVTRIRVSEAVNLSCGTTRNGLRRATTLGLAPSKSLRVGAHIAKSFLAGPAVEWRNFPMSEVLPFAPRSGDSAMIAKLISAGYLQPEQRDDPSAVTRAIARMKQHLRTGNGSDDPPAA
jgi:hypothetical protein